MKKIFILFVLCSVQGNWLHINNNLNRGNRGNRNSKSSKSGMKRVRINTGGYRIHINNDIFHRNSNSESAEAELESSEINSRLKGQWRKCISNNVHGLCKRSGSCTPGTENSDPSKCSIGLDYCIPAINPCYSDKGAGACAPREACNNEKLLFKIEKSTYCKNSVCCIPKIRCSLATGVVGVCTPQLECNGGTSISYTKHEDCRERGQSCCVERSSLTTTCFAYGKAGSCKTSGMCNSKTESAIHGHCTTGRDCCIRAKRCSVAKGVVGVCTPQLECSGGTTISYTILGDCRERGQSCCVERSLLTTRCLAYGIAGSCKASERCDGRTEIAIHGRCATGRYCCIRARRCSVAKGVVGVCIPQLKCNRETSISYTKYGNCREPGQSCCIERSSLKKTCFAYGNAGSCKTSGRCDNRTENAIHGHCATGRDCCIRARRVVKKCTVIARPNSLEGSCKSNCGTHAEFHAPECTGGQKCCVIPGGIHSTCANHKGQSGYCVETCTDDTLMPSTSLICLSSVCCSRDPDSFTIN